MLEELAGLSVVDLGSTGLLAIVVVLILTGKLVPRKQVDAFVAIVVTEKDYWRAAHTVSEGTVRMQAQQMAEMLEASRTSTAVVRALPLPPQDGEV